MAPSNKDFISQFGDTLNKFPITHCNTKIIAKHIGINIFVLIFVFCDMYLYINNKIPMFTNTPIITTYLSQRKRFTPFLKIALYKMYPKYIKNIILKQFFKIFLIFLPLYLKLGRK